MYDVPFDVAERALAHWRADAGSLEHLGTSGNAVHRFTVDGAPHILRLTDPAHRSVGETRAEMAFLEHLQTHGVRANAPVRSRANRSVEIEDGYAACVLTWAPGIVVMPDSPHWNADFLREWGSSLARIHVAASDYRGPARWDWREENLLVEAPALFPADDAPVRAEFARVMAALAEVPRDATNGGMIHADYAPGNFHFVPGEGIHAFDFGNCCGHWFLSDVAISLSVLRRRPDRGRCGAWLLEGYRSVRPIDERLLPHLDTLIQLRILYVLLSRLKKFGPHPDDTQRATLAILRAAVLERFRWPMETLT